MSDTAALVLAAGGSSRFGAPKLLVPVHGRPLLRHALDIAAAVLPDNVYVVLGAHADRLEPVASGARVVRNPDWQRGLSSSIAAGLSALPAETGHVLLLLADQVGLDGSDLARLLAAHDGQAGITCGRYQGVLGVPALFSRTWFPSLRELRGDEGARGLLRAHAERVRAVDLPRAAFDIDTVDDLREWERGTGTGQD